jgi:putative endonuclease
MNTSSLGSEAEQLVAEHLKEKGYKILDQNWRRPTCEIDIIAQKDSAVYFVEVKFRVRTDQGGGLDHITPSKLKQMTFAAATWSAENDWRGDCRLMAAAVNYNGLAMSLAELEEIT